MRSPTTAECRGRDAADRDRALSAWSWAAAGHDARGFLLCDVLDGFGFSIASYASRGFGLTSLAAWIQIHLRHGGVPRRLAWIHVLTEMELEAVWRFAERHRLARVWLGGLAELEVSSLCVVVAPEGGVHLEDLPVAALHAMLEAA